MKYSKALYDNFKFLLTLNKVGDYELYIDEQDDDIIRAVYNDLFIKDIIHYEQFLSIVKGISIDIIKSPVSTAMIIHDQLKKKDK